jgi:hypothetical protein
MLAICLLAVGAFAADTEAPVISLNLPSLAVPTHRPGAQASHGYEGRVGYTATIKQSNHEIALAKSVLGKSGKSWSPATKSNCGTRPVPDTFTGHAIKKDQRSSCYDRSKNHFVGMTAYVVGMTGSDAKLPAATAYDIHDGALTPEPEDVVLVAEAVKCNDVTNIGTNGNCDNNLATSKYTTFPQKDWATTSLKRAEYVASWRAEDGAGNEAEVIAYSVIVFDHEAPKPTSDITATYNRNFGYEFATQLDTQSVRFTDNYDTLVKIKESKNAQLFKPCKGHDSFRASTGNCYIAPSTGSNVEVQYKKAGGESGFDFEFSKCANGKFGYQYEISDSANIFGASNDDNVYRFTAEFTVKDTTPPTFEQLKLGQVGLDTFECDHKAKAKDVIPFPFFGSNGQAVIMKDNSKSIMKTEDGHDCDATLNIETIVQETGKFTANAKGSNGLEIEGDYKAGCANIRAARNNRVSSCTVEYVAKDWQGNLGPAKDSSTRTFEVVDTTAPIIYTHHDKMDYSNKDSTHTISTSTIKHKYIPATKGAQLIADQVHLKKNKDLKNAQGSTSKITFASNQNENVIYHEEGTITGIDGKMSKADEAFKNSLLDLSCSDSCDKTVETQFVWQDGSSGTHQCNVGNANGWSKPSGKDYSLTEAGTYVLKYECRDASHNYAAVCRTVINEEATKPIIDINCKKDQGADLYMDGYNRCDNITVPAQQGGFNDPSAQCFSYKEGNINQNVVISGESVNLAVKGTYIITYNCAASGAKGKQAAYQAHEAYRTVYVVDGAPAQCSINPDDLTSCEGLKQKDCTAAYDEGHPWEQKHHVALPYNWTTDQEASFPYEDAVPACSDNVDTFSGDHSKKFCPQQVTGKLSSGDTVTYDCVDITKFPCQYGGADQDPNDFVDVEETGTYVLTYTVTDENVNTAQYMKTVVVVDRMAPEIVLSYTGTGLMEENTFVNGWVVGAVASAITGIAMLAISSKNSVATSVPV